MKSGHRTSPHNTRFEWCGGKAIIEDDYPSIIFAIDDEIYQLAGKQCIVIGGAYSVDRYFRLERGWGWWADEQPSVEIKQYVEQ